MNRGSYFTLQSVKCKVINIYEGDIFGIPHCGYSKDVNFLVAVVISKYFLVCINLHDFTTLRTHHMV